MAEEKIDQFIIISSSVGTFARAFDCSSSVKQPSLHMSAATASRDITVGVVEERNGWLGGKKVQQPMMFGGQSEGKMIEVLMTKSDQLGIG